MARGPVGAKGAEGVVALADGGSLAVVDADGEEVCGSTPGADADDADDADNADAAAIDDDDDDDGDCGGDDCKSVAAAARE